MNLMRASNQWSSRPIDQRYWNLRDLATAAIDLKDKAATAVSRIRDLVICPSNDERGLVFKGKEGREAEFSHWSFSQLCRNASKEDERASTPAEYLRTLPPELAARALNFDLQTKTAEDATVEMLIGRDSKLPTARMTSRAFTSEKYARIWNADISYHMLPLLDIGWKTPPARPAMDDPRARAATAEDCVENNGGGGQKINVGDMIAPAGCYLSDKDMFVLLCNETKPVDAGGGTFLYKGLMVSNSEVGARTFRVTSFLYNGICGNHIIWGAKDVEDKIWRHIGEKTEHNALNFVKGLRMELIKYADSDTTELSASIKQARIFEIGKDKDEVMNALFAKRISTRKNLEAAFDLADNHREDGGNVAPTTAWGMAQGLTRLSQATAYMDARLEIDQAATKVLEMATPKVSF